MRYAHSGFSSSLVVLALVATFTACGKEPPAEPPAEPVAKAEPAAPDRGAAPGPGAKPNTGAKVGVKPNRGSRPSAQPVYDPNATPEVSFASPRDGATVKGIGVDGKVNVPVRMKVAGMKLKPAGPVEERAGHHHVIIDGGPIKKGKVIPADDTHLHFGKAETSALIPLAPGKHKLTLQFADGAHASYGEELSATVEIRVVAMAGAAPTPAATPKPAPKPAAEKAEPEE